MWQNIIQIIGGRRSGNAKPRRTDDCGTVCFGTGAVSPRYRHKKGRKVCMPLPHQLLFTALASYHLFNWLGIFSSLPSSLLAFYYTHPNWFTVLYFFLIYLLTGLICAKAALIGTIRLYQHYAPEEIRRRCLFKPTCSEYAILALQKYGIIIGLFKTYVRLFKKCRGNIYRIDYP